MIISKPNIYPHRVENEKYIFTLYKNGLVFFDNWPNKNNKIYNVSKWEEYNESFVKIIPNISDRFMDNRRFDYYEYYLDEDSDDDDLDEEESDISDDFYDALYYSDN